MRCLEFSLPGLFMARQAVRQASNLVFRLLQMAIQAPTHVHLHGGSCDRHVTDVTVAGFTILACPQVRLMAEVNEFRLFANADPWDWFAALPITRQGLDSRAVSRNGGMAAHTFFHGWYPGYV